MAAIHDLIAQVGDAPLRDRLATEWAKATRERKFGLGFEDHLPELMPLLLINHPAQLDALFDGVK